MLKKQDGRNTLNSVFERDGLMLININLANFGFALGFFRDLIDGGTKHATRLAPLRPKVHQHWNGALENFAIKICFCKFDCVWAGHGFLINCGQCVLDIFH